jgi:hypothetical protein
MNNLKHVGRITSTKRKVIVAYRVVPNEPDNCIVVTTENLMADEHDSLMKLVESDAGQSENDLADAMARTRLPDGRIMLSAFHSTGKMVKVSTTQVEMVPNNFTTILLKDLNEIIAKQAGVSVADLAVSNGTKTTTTQVENTVVSVADEPLSDEAIAAKYRSDADRLYKEAKQLREAAEKLSPTKKKTSELSD